jgi:hypothetical protein
MRQLVKFMTGACLLIAISIPIKPVLAKHLSTEESIQQEVQKAIRQNSTVPNQFNCLSEHYLGVGVNFKENGEWDHDGNWYHRTSNESQWDQFNVEGGTILRLKGMIVVFRHTASLSEPAHCAHRPLDEGHD